MSLRRQQVLSSPGFETTPPETPIVPIRGGTAPVSVARVLNSSSSAIQQNDVQVQLLLVRTEMEEKRLIEDQVITDSGSRDCCGAVEHLRAMIHDAIVMCESAENRPLPTPVVKPAAIEERLHRKDPGPQVSSYHNTGHRVTPPSTPTRPRTPTPLPNPQLLVSPSGNRPLSGQPPISIGHDGVRVEQQTQHYDSYGVSSSDPSGRGRISSPKRTTATRQPVDYIAVPSTSALAHNRLSVPNWEDLTNLPPPPMGGTNAASTLGGGGGNDMTDVLASMTTTPNGTRKYDSLGYYGQKNRERFVSTPFESQTTTTRYNSSYQQQPSAYQQQQQDVSVWESSRQSAMANYASGGNNNGTTYQPQHHLGSNTRRDDNDEDIHQLEMKLKEKEVQLLQMRINKVEGGGSSRY